MEALRSADEIRDVNTRYHDVAAAGYDSKWGIDFGSVGQAQVVGKLRKLLGTAWTKVTGKVPPTDLTDPKVTLVEALAWSVATGIVVETARFAIVRSTMRKSPTETGAESS